MRAQWCPCCFVSEGPIKAACPLHVMVVVGGLLQVTGSIAGPALKGSLPSVLGTLKSLLLLMGHLCMNDSVSG